MSVGKGVNSTYNILCLMQEKGPPSHNHVFSNDHLDLLASVLAETVIDTDRSAETPNTSSMSILDSKWCLEVQQDWKRPQLKLIRTATVVWSSLHHHLEF